MPTGGARTVKVRFDGDERGLDQAAKRSSSALSAFGSVAKKTAAVIAVGLGAAVVGAKKAIDAASDLNETTSKMEQVFPKAKNAIADWADFSASAFGLTRQAALEGASSFGNFFNQIGIGEKQSAKMSKGLIKLSADLGSFNNASPQEVMESFLSATRGEYDSLQKFIPTVNAAKVQTEALRLSHKKSVKDLTDADKALALYSIAQRDAGKAQGDFARTSTGVANQTRILSAQAGDLKAMIGQALLPVWNQLLIVLTGQVMPALNELWHKHGPQIIAFLSNATTQLGGFVANLKTVDFGAKWEQFRTTVVALLPSMQQLKDAGGPLTDTLKVGGVVVGFLADHLDTLAKLLPYIIFAIGAYKTAQAAANVVALLAVPTKIAEVVVNRQLVKSNRALVASRRAATASQVTDTVATVANTGAENVGILTRSRSVVGMVAQRVAMVAVRVATIAWTAVQWLLNAALTANPIGLVIVAIAALIAIIILIATKTTWFQTAWKYMTMAIAVAWNWLWSNVIKPVIDFIIGYLKFLISIVMWVKDKVVLSFQAWLAVIALVIDWFKRLGARILSDVGKVVGFIIGLPGKIRSAFSNLAEIIASPFKAAFNRIARLWNGSVGKLSFNVPGWVPGIGGNSFSLPKLPELDTGGFVRQSGLAIIHKGETVQPADTAPLSGNGGPDTLILYVDLGDGIEQKIELKLDEHDRKGDKSYRQTGGRRRPFGGTAGAMG
jgi:hypothetical protein